MLDAKPTDLHEVLTDCEFMLPRLLGSDVQLTFQHQAARSWIRADAAQLEQVIANLAINARDAMPEGGTLQIRTADQALNGEPDELVGSFVAISFADTGGGIAPRVLSRVFEPFFTTKKPGEGTGLGLSMVYGFAKQSHGTVTINSVVGQGTTITLYLPRGHGEAEG